MATNLKQSIGSGLQIKLEGDWFKVNRIINNLPLDIKAGYMAGQLSAAKKFKKIILSYIGSNGKSLDWPPVSVDYAISKISKGGDPNQMLFLTGAYKRAIEIQQRGSSIRVGINQSARNKEGMKVKDYAKVLELGSEARNIQPRPLWEPAFREFGGKARIKRLIMFHISQRYIMHYGYKPKLKF